MIRWVDTKEEHASNIIETVSTYFLVQKVPIAINIISCMFGVCMF